MAIYKIEKKWYFRCYYDTFEGRKQYKSKKYDTKAEAQEAERLFLIKRDNPIHKEFKLIANDYFDYLYKIKKESTVYTYIQDYNNHIKPYFENTYIDAINTQTILQWEDKLEKQGYNVHYLNKIYSVLVQIFKYAMRVYSLQFNPVEVAGRFQKKNDEVKKDKDKLRYLTIDEFNKFISVIENPTHYAYFNFAFWTGCRRGEISALKWEDIDLENGYITIDKTLNEKLGGKITSTKNNLNRKIQMSKTLKEIMIKYKSNQMEYSDFNEQFFVFGGSTYLANTTIDRYKKKYFELSGVHEITMHEFRHSHVSNCINAYLNSGQTDTTKFFLMMSNRMGHTIEVMQSTYLHLFPTIQNEIVDLLNNM